MLRTIIVAVLILVLAGASAQAVEYTVSGFASIVGGGIVAGDGGDPEFPRGPKVPVFVGDYYTGAMYEDGKVSFAKESRVGLQLNVDLTSSFSVVAQAVARAYTEKVKVEWLYASWRPTENWTVQVGRKRIPIYFYSEFQDVGVVYNWVRPPQALYGWEASNYNGGSLAWSEYFGDTSLRASVYGGQEQRNPADMNAIYYDVDYDSKWQNLFGGDLEVNRGWFTGRVVYLQSDNYSRDHAEGGDWWEPPMSQKIMGLAINGDFGRWFFTSEFNLNAREDVEGENEDGDLGLVDVDAPAYMLGAGYRFGPYTAQATWSRYWETSTSDGDYYWPERFEDWSFVLRRDIGANYSVKLQFDRMLDKSLWEYYGNTSFVSGALDVTF